MAIITDFGPVGTPTEVYNALVADLSYLGSIGGGTLFFPERSADYDVSLDPSQGRIRSLFRSTT